ncbi:MAG: ABC transporter permease, partial [Blastocatellia bacterium]|nr:ABC transporter permease [Blastocatellia bacterium]
MENLYQDLRYAVRMLLKKPGFTLAAVLTLAIGIGANTTIFSLLNAAFLRPLPGDAPDRLVTLLVRSDDSSLNESFSYPDYADIRDQSKSLSGLAAYGSLDVSLSVEVGAEVLAGEIVTGNYFDVLGVKPVLGRTFLPEEDRVPGQSPVVVLSYDLWRERFGADPGMIGRDIVLNGYPYSVIGVAPRGFNSALLGRSSRFWVPAMMQGQIAPASAGTRRMVGSADLLDVRSTSWLRIVGRLHAEVNLDQARAELEVISPGIAQNSPQMTSDSSLTAVQLGNEPGLREAAVPVL